MRKAPTDQAQSSHSGASDSQPLPPDTDPMPEVGEWLVGSVEALLMAAESPLTVDRLVRLVGRIAIVDRADVRVALAALGARYAESAADLVEVAGGWRFQVGGDYGELLAGLWEERPPRLSRAMLETLAIICYRQPLTRSDIEAIRGVSVSTGLVRTLSEYEWIKVIGHREVPGRPALYATTSRFLDDFGVKRLSDLPSLPEIRNLDALDTAVVRLESEAGQTAADASRAARQAGDPSS